VPKLRVPWCIRAMSRVDTAHNVLRACVVYWGPAGSGKTAHLEALQRRLDPEEHGCLYSVATPEGGTVLPDVLPVEEFRFGTFRVRTRVLGVPGEPARGPVRVATVGRADVLVFVADARRARLDANRASLEELEAAVGEDVPVVWVLNRLDDTDAMTAGELRAELGIADGTAYETAAPSGRGVFEAFGEALRLALGRLAERHALKDADLDAAVPENLLPQLARGARPPARPGDPRIAVEVDAGNVVGVAQAVQAHLDLADAHIAATTANRILRERNGELMAVNRVARSILSALDAENLLVVLLDATAEHLRAGYASCVLFDPGNAGKLRTHVLGFGRDPVLGLSEPDARGFFDLMRDSDGPVPASAEHNPRLLHALRRVDRRVKGAMFQPVKSKHDQPAGWIAIYSVDENTRLSTQALLFLSSISRLAALGLGKIALFDELKGRVATNEQAIRERTSRLEMANAKIRALNRGLEARVTERTRALEEVNRKLRAARASAVHDARLRGMGQVAASFAHEVNNPIAGLAANLAYMRESLDELRARVAGAGPEAAEGLRALEEFEEILAESTQSAERITGIIASLKRFGDEEDARDRFTVNALVADAVTLVEERLQEAAALDLRLGTVPEMHGDSRELGHVALALLTNAVEAVERSGERGTITVTTFATGDRVSLVVQDDGAGVPTDILPRVFEPFVSTKDEPSAGLGLHCAYKTVEAWGGEMRIRSKPGEGTTVTVVLPAERPVEEAEDAPSSASGSGKVAP